MKKRALVIDFGEHSKQIEHATLLWSEFELDYLGVDDYAQTSSVYLRKYIISKRFSNFKRAVLLFLFAFNYNKIIVITAPEYDLNSFSQRVVRIIWAAFVIIFGSKVELYVKNIQSYEASKVLKLTLKSVNRIFLESQFCKDIFIKSFPKICNNKIKVSYVYYPDFNNNLTEKNIEPLLSSYVESSDYIVGIIGQFNTTRRDYSVLKKLFSDYKLDDVNFLQIGSCSKDVESRKIKEALGYKLDFLKEHYTNAELDYLLESSDLLVSFNKFDCGYHEGKGTAAFSEAISVNKKLIVPSFLNSITEFSNISLYYGDVNELACHIIREKCKNIKETTGDEYDFFSSSNVKKRNGMVN